MTMAEQADGQHLTDDSPQERLWTLASELDPSLEGVEERVERAHARLQLAGMMLAQGEDEDWTRSDRDIAGPPEPYPRGVSPVSGSLHGRA
jgi:hypothetical protein